MNKENDNDLISRKALKKHKFSSPDPTRAYDETTIAYKRGWNDAIDEVINNAPTIDPYTIQAIFSDYLVYSCEPQKLQGKWIEDNGDLRCPFCRVLRDSIHGSFCSNCGADMRGGSEND